MILLIARDISIVFWYWKSFYKAKYSLRFLSDVNDAEKVKYFISFGLFILLKQELFNLPVTQLIQVHLLDSLSLQKLGPCVIVNSCQFRNEQLELPLAHVLHAEVQPLVHSCDVARESAHRPHLIGDELVDALC